MLIEEIVKFINPIEVSLIHSHDVLKVDTIDNSSFSLNSLGWCSDKNEELLHSVKGGTVIISTVLNDKLVDKTSLPINLIVVQNPRFTFAEVLRHFFVKKLEFGKIHTSTVIDSSVSYNPKTCIIEPNVVIEANVQISDNVIIGANTVIKEGTVIGNHVKIGSNCTIGGVGFGYEPNEEGVYELIPHVGNVVINDRVEIGNNTCIDRAVMGSTFLDTEVKIDNLVHIAHGVQIGANSLVIANAMVAGSVKIGKNSWISPSASIRQKIEVGDNALVGLGSVVVKNVNDKDIVAGVPAKKIN
jgi:UDP-3-O-[3-hydroxymyristoyl] glucosamine N-acyltransferase